MFRFANPEFLYLLILVPIFLGLNIYIALSRKKALERFGNLETIKPLMPSISFVRPRVKFYLLLSAFTIIIFTLAAPQFGSKVENIKRKGIEIIIALDVSNSMNSKDLEPSRLERAKMGISQLVDKLKDDRIGLIVFAGEAYTQLPITSDYGSAKMFLGSISTNSVQRQGTAIGSAISLASKSFTQLENVNRVIIVVTDGENHEDDAIEEAKEATKRGIRVITVGMGLPNGSPIPIIGGGPNDFLKDKQGNVVITKLNEPMLQEIADAGAGIYVPARNLRGGIDNLLDVISKLEKSEFDSQVITEYDEQFQYLAIIVLLLLIIEFIILERKNRFFRKINLFESKQI